MQNSVNVTNPINGETRRVRLPKPRWTGREELQAGYWLTGLYVGPRNGLLVAEFDSIRVNYRTNWIEGTTYELVNKKQFNHFAEMVGIDVLP
jgi:hypothetical protein